jgi:hypothetical protein
MQPNIHAKPIKRHPERSRVGDITGFPWVGVMAILFDDGE